MMRWIWFVAVALAAGTGCTYDAIYGADPEEQYEASLAESEKLEREEMRARELEGQIVGRSLAASTITIQDARTNQTWTLTLDPSSSVYTAGGERLGTVALREGARVRASFDMMVDELRANRIVLIEGGNGAQPQSAPQSPPAGQ